MSNTVIGIIIAVVVLGGGAYVVTQISSEEDNAEVNTQSESEQQTPESFTGTIEGLMSLGQSVRCTFTHTDEESAVDGTIYAAGDRLRGDFTASQGGSEAFDGSMIREGETIHMWGETPQGMFATQMTVSEQEAQQQTAVDLDQEIDYNCSAWDVDEQMFAVPSDIEFQDMSAQMQGMQQSSDNMREMQCQACADLADPDARAQCEAALSCS